MYLGQASVKAVGNVSELCANNVERNHKSTSDHLHQNPHSNFECSELGSAEIPKVR